MSKKNSQSSLLPRLLFLLTIPLLTQPTLEPAREILSTDEHLNLSVSFSSTEGRINHSKIEIPFTIDYEYSLETSIRDIELHIEMESLFGSAVTEQMIMFYDKLDESSFIAPPIDEDLQEEHYEAPCKTVQKKNQYYKQLHAQFQYKQFDVLHPYLYAIDDLGMLNRIELQLMLGEEMIQQEFGVVLNHPDVVFNAVVCDKVNQHVVLLDSEYSVRVFQDDQQWDDFGPLWDNELFEFKAWKFEHGYLIVLSDGGEIMLFQFEEAQSEDEEEEFVLVVLLSETIADLSINDATVNENALLFLADDDGVYMVDLDDQTTSALSIIYPISHTIGLASTAQVLAVTHPLVENDNKFLSELQIDEEGLVWKAYEMTSSLPSFDINLSIDERYIYTVVDSQYIFIFRHSLPDVFDKYMLYFEVIDGVQILPLQEIYEDDIFTLKELPNNIAVGVKPDNESDESIQFYTPMIQVKGYLECELISGLNERVFNISVEVIALDCKLKDEQYGNQDYCAYIKNFIVDKKIEVIVNHDRTWSILAIVIISVIILCIALYKFAQKKKPTEDIVKIPNAPVAGGLYEMRPRIHENKNIPSEGSEQYLDQPYLGLGAGEMNRGEPAKKDAFQ
jgi:hypothetical protein